MASSKEAQRSSSEPVAPSVTVYLASPLGFSDSTKSFMNDQLIPAIRSTGVAVINPWEASADNEAMIAHAKSMRNLDKRRKAWQNAVLSLGSANAESIKKADGIVAVLDGVDVDSGTAAEIGYATAMGKWVIGYRGDFRRTGEDETSEVNLQVEYFIRSRGGVVVHDLSSLTKELKNRRKRQT